VSHLSPFSWRSMRECYLYLTSKHPAWRAQPQSVTARRAESRRLRRRTQLAQPPRAAARRPARRLWPIYDYSIEVPSYGRSGFSTFGLCAAGATTGNTRCVCAPWGPQHAAAAGKCRCASTGRWNAGPLDRWAAAGLLLGCLHRRRCCFSHKRRTSSPETLSRKQVGHPCLSADFELSWSCHGIGGASGRCVGAPVFHIHPHTRRHPHFHT